MARIHSIQKRTIECFQLESHPIYQSSEQSCRWCCPNPLWHTIDKIYSLHIIKVFCHSPLLLFHPRPVVDSSTSNPYFNSFAIIKWRTKLMNSQTRNERMNLDSVQEYINRQQQKLPRMPQPPLTVLWCPCNRGEPILLARNNTSYYFLNSKDRRQHTSIDGLEFY